MRLSDKEEFIQKILAEYAVEKKVAIRELSELSPLEIHLIFKLYHENMKFKRAMRYVAVKKAIEEGKIKFN